MADAVEPFNTSRLSVRLANTLVAAGLVTPEWDGDYRAERFVDREKLATKTDLDLLRIKNLGRKGLEELRSHGLIPPAPGAPPVSPDIERLAAIGHAVVVHLMGTDPRPMREATVERVISHLKRREDEARSVANSRALRVGRLMLTLVDEVNRE